MPARLHRYLLVRVAAALAAVMLIGGAGLAVSAHVGQRAAQEAQAGTLERLLEVQLMGFSMEMRPPDAFPDWAVISQALAGAHGCAVLQHKDGATWRSECRAGAATSGVPHWFVALHDAVLGRLPAVTRDIEGPHGIFARLVWTPDNGARLVQAWRDVSTLGGTMLATGLVVGAVLYILSTRALRPLEPILDKLGRLDGNAPGAALAMPPIAELARLAAAVDTLGERLHESEQARLRLAAKAVAAQDLEREHLARELHDELGQHLAGIAALAAGFRHDASSLAPSLATDAARIEALLSGVQAQLRDLLRFLRPPALAEEGLAGALRSLARHWQQHAQAGQEYALEVAGALDALPAEAAHHVYRIVQEGLTNSARHGGGQTVRVALTVTTTDTSVPTLEIRFESATAPPTLPSGGGLGRIGIAERAALLGGQVEFDAAPGVPLRVTVPIVSTWRNV